MKKKILGFITTLLVGVVLTACGNGATDSDKTVVTVGVVGAFQQHWGVVNELLAEDGIYVDLVTFNDFTTPNTALDAGDIDLNAFQNIGFFENALYQNGYDLVSLGNTFISPMNIFAGGQGEKIAPDYTRSSLLGYIQDGAVIGIPSDLTNGGRALKVLEAAGLITMDPAVGFLGTENDIIEFHVDIEIYAVESAMLPSLLPDLDAAVINTVNALTGGLSPNDDSIFREDALNLEIADHLINIIAARAEDADNPIFRKIIEAYQTEGVAEAFRIYFEGGNIPAW